MMRSLSSDLPGFKSLEFRPGLNILLADKSEGATNRQSRNGAGKTSFVELIHFLFGASANPNSIFRSDALNGARFTADVDVAGTPVRVTRSGSKASRIFIEGDVAAWPLEPQFEKKTGERSFKNDDWKSLLGAAVFALPLQGEGDGAGRFRPTFRSLFSYFARRQDNFGFNSPFQHSDKQQAWDQQVSVSCLLGLDSGIPREFEELRVQERSMKELRKAAKQGSLGRYLRLTVGELRTRLTVADDKAQRMRQEVESFTVIPEYSALEKEADDITRAIRSLHDQTTIDRELVSQLREALEDERPPAEISLKRLYEEAGVILPDTVHRRFEEVQRFHEAIVANRQAHLSGEIEDAEMRIRSREDGRQRLDLRRRQIMKILRSGGALDQYARLQDEASRAEAEAENLRQQLTIVERLESTQTEIEGERNRLLRTLRMDHRERTGQITEAIRAFEQLSEALYEQEGSLTIDAGPNGPTFNVQIQSQRSGGIRNMQIFCFDMMLVDLTAKRGLGPGFLIHDSHLFDGVDERQVAKALQLGAEHAELSGYQYIVTLNSDAVPQEGFQPDFNVDDYVLPVRLTDATEDGGLFGVRFD